MHTNHRRSKPRFRDSNIKFWWFGCHSLKYYRRVRATARRREERHHIYNEDWDNLKTRYPKDMLWEF